jgi:nucleoside-diphosphate-sugar epimerase
LSKKILITGSTGFVGRHLIPKLINEGYDILEVTRNIEKSTKLFKGATKKVNIESRDFKNAIVDFNPSFVIHLASYLTASDSWDDVDKLITSNLVLLAKVLNAVSANDLKLFVNTGTFAEYQKGNEEFVPAYFYAATKTASRSFVDYFSKAYKFKQTTVVPYTIYGGVDSQKKIIDLIYDSTLNHKKIDLTAGEQVLDFIHIDDVVEFYITLLEKYELLPEKSNLHIGSGVGYNLKQVADLIESITSRKTNINWGGRKYRETDVMYAVANLADVKSILNWCPKIKLKEGIRKDYI